MVFGFNWAGISLGPGVRDLRFDRQGRQIDSVPGGHLLAGTDALQSSEPTSSQTRTGHETTGTVSVLWSQRVNGKEKKRLAGYGQSSGNVW